MPRTQRLNCELIKATIEKLKCPLVEKTRTIYTVCPVCRKSDKLSILKSSGYTICYRGKCDFKGPRPFLDWVSLTAKCSKDEAKRLVFGGIDENYNIFLQLKKASLPKISFNLGDNEDVSFPKPIIFPEKDFKPIADIDSLDGVRYLNNRGISLPVSMYYNIYYSSFLKRIIFPVTLNGFVIGWQGRLIFNDPNKPKSLNNLNFPKSKAIMFYDLVEPNKFIVITEGPFDSMKFYNVKNSVATLGKSLSVFQKRLILYKNPQKIYFAWDEDALADAVRYAKELNKKVYIVRVPDSAKQRLKNVKVDFGECSFEECERAINDAELYTPNKLFFSLSVK